MGNPHPNPPVVHNLTAVGDSATCCQNAAFLIPEFGPTARFSRLHCRFPRASFCTKWQNSEPLKNSPLRNSCHDTELGIPAIPARGPAAGLRKPERISAAGCAAAKLRHAVCHTLYAAHPAAARRQMCCLPRSHSSGGRTATGSRARHPQRW